MKKSLLLLSSLFLIGVSPVYAQSDAEIKELESTIEVKQKELNELKTQLDELTADKKTDSGGYSKEQAEKNAEEYPAGPGRVLATKGNHDFTGMPYYFKGELIEAGTDEVFKGKTIWLIKNEKGYVIPVEMLDGETADVGAEVEVWGTLSGEGYSFPNVENVVGETGYLIMMQYAIDGEDII